MSMRTAFSGTKKRDEFMKELYETWKDLPKEKRTPRRVSAICSVSIRLAREEYIPVLEELDEMANERNLIKEPTAEERKKAIEAQQARHNAMMSKKTGKKTGTRQGSNESGK